MWEANGEDDDAMLWAGTNFFGGLSRHREGVCGVVSAMAVYLGFRFRSRSEDEAEADQAKEKARAEAARLAQVFKDKYNSEYRIKRSVIKLTPLAYWLVVTYFYDDRSICSR